MITGLLCVDDKPFAYNEGWMFSSRSEKLDKFLKKNLPENWRKWTVFEVFYIDGKVKLKAIFGSVKGE